MVMYTISLTSILIGISPRGEDIYRHSVIMEHIKFSHHGTHKIYPSQLFFEESHYILESIDNVLCNLLFTPIHVHISIVEV